MIIYAALSYFIIPIDAILDVLPGGYIDDLAIVSEILHTIPRVYEKYKIDAEEWLIDNLGIILKEKEEVKK